MLMLVFWPANRGGRPWAFSRCVTRDDVDRAVAAARRAFPRRARQSPPLAGRLQALTGLVYNLFGLASGPTVIALVSTQFPGADALRNGLAETLSAAICVGVVSFLFASRENSTKQAERMNLEQVGARRGKPSMIGESK